MLIIYYLGRPHGQGHAGQGPAQGQPHGPDYSRQWEEYWKQMNPNQPHHSQSPYSAHGQVDTFCNLKDYKIYIKAFNLTFNF